jgi:hypothetical protein
MAEDPLEAFPGHGRMKAAEVEIAQLPREVHVMFAFVAKHRGSGRSRRSPRRSVSPLLPSLSGQPSKPHRR